MNPDDIINVGVQNLEELRAQLADVPNPDAVPPHPGSAFYQNAHFVEGRREVVLAALARLGEGMRQDGHNERFNITSLDDLGLTMEDFRELNRGNYKLFLTFEVPTSTGESTWLSPDEFNMWQGIVEDRAHPASVSDVSHPEMFADLWAREVGVTIQSEARPHQIGDRTVYLENPTKEFNPLNEGRPREQWVGASRAVSEGRILTERYGDAPQEILDYIANNPQLGLQNPEFSYGYFDIEDRDPDSATRGGPALVYDGQLDGNFSAETLRSGVAMNGTVVILERMEDGHFDPKVFDCDDPREAIIGESVGFGGPRQMYGTVAGITFEPEISLPVQFVRYLETAQGRYITLSGAQFAAYEHAISENEEYRNMSVSDWIEHAYGTRQNFDRIFPGDGPLSLEEYHRSSPQSNNIPRLGDYLHLNRTQGDQVEAYRRDYPGMLFGEAAVELGLVTEQQLNMALLQQAQDRRTAAVGDMRRLADGVIFPGMNAPFFSGNLPQEPDRLDAVIASANVAQLITGIAARHPELAERFRSHVEYASLLSGDLLSGRLENIEHYRDIALSGLREIVNESGYPLPSGITIDDYITQTRAQIDAGIADAREMAALREAQGLADPNIVNLPTIQTSRGAAIQ